MKKISICGIVILAALVTLGPAVQAEALCVRVSKANLRSGPGTAYEVVWEVYKYMPFDKVGTSLQGGWYAVQDVDGDVSWIHRNLVTSRYRCAVVKSAEVNVRTGPGTRYAKSPVGPAKQYASFRVVKRKGPWIKLKDEWGSSGWIHRNFLWIH